MRKPVYILCLACLLCGCGQKELETIETMPIETETETHLFVEISKASGKGEADMEDEFPGEEETTKIIDGTGNSQEEPDSGEPVSDSEDSASNGGGSAGTDTKENASSGVFEKEDCGIHINGVFLTAGIDFSPFIDMVGSNVKIVEGQACLEGGYDTNYYYGEDLAVYTYASDGKQIIYDIYVTGASYAMDKGAKVGTSTSDQIHELYGEPGKSAVSADSYSISQSSIEVTFEYKNGILESIDILEADVNT